MLLSSNQGGRQPTLGCELNNAHVPSTPSRVMACAEDGLRPSRATQPYFSVLLPRHKVGGRDRRVVFS